MKVLVTGATSGIGLGTALALSRAGHEVLLHGRNEARCASAAARVAPAACLSADFSRLDEVRRFADEVLAHAPDVIVHNAGALPVAREVTADGFETQFQVNHLAPVLISRRLLRHRRAAGAHPQRVVVVSSHVHAGAPLDLGDLQWEKRAYCSGAVHACTKLLNVLFTFALARRASGSLVNCLTPGIIGTKALAAYGGRRTEQDCSEAEALRGAQTSVYLAVSPQLDVTAGYFRDCKQVSPSAQSQDRALQEKIWELSESLLGL